MSSDELDLCACKVSSDYNLKYLKSQTRIMSDELEKGLNEIRQLIHDRMNQLHNYNQELDGRKLDDEYIKECFSRLYTSMVNFWVHLESFYIMNEAFSKKTDSLKDSILELREVRSDPLLKSKIKKIYDSYNETTHEFDKSFKRVHGIDWDLDK